MSSHATKLLALTTASALLSLCGTAVVGQLPGIRAGASGWHAGADAAWRWYRTTRPGPLPAGPSDGAVRAVPAAPRDGDGGAVRGYWTRERMRHARVAAPVHRSPRDPGPVVAGPGAVAGSGAGAGSGGSAGAGARPAPDAAVPGLPRYSPEHGSRRFRRAAIPSIGPLGGMVRRTTGKVFFTLHGQDLVCSASVVRAADRDTVLTAGHCVNDGAGTFASSWMFVPGYRDGQAPYGMWPARLLATTSGWVERADSDVDVGFAVVRTVGGRHLADVVGAQKIGFEQRASGVADVFGYPRGAGYDGEHLVSCEGTVHPDDLARSHSRGMACDMKDGASGGPWFSQFDPGSGAGIVTSVTSFGYPNAPDVLWGPYFGPEVRETYRVVERY